MPTARRRYQVTETDEVAEALDRAERRWPGEQRSRLLLRLITENGELLAEEQEAELARRRAEMEWALGSGTGLYEPGYRDELRDEWPE